MKNEELSSKTSKTATTSDLPALSPIPIERWRQTGEGVQFAWLQESLFEQFVDGFIMPNEPVVHERWHEIAVFVAFPISACIEIPELHMASKVK